MKIHSHSQPSPLIAKANILVEASYKLTLAEQRLLLAVLAIIESHPDQPALLPDVGITVTSGGIADLFEVARSDTYALLQDAADRLAERWVVIDAPDVEAGDPVRTKSRWVSAITYLPDSGAVMLYLAPKVIPYLTQLAGDFTRYRLANVARMNSVYAIRLYELLVQWQSEGQREVSIEWIKEKFRIPDSYARIGDLKTRVIKPAVEQINAHSNLWVRYAQRKSGRQVVALQFEFGLRTGPQPGQAAGRLNHSADQQGCLVPDAAPIPRRRVPTDRELSDFAHPGESREAALARWRQQHQDANRQPAVPGEAPSGAPTPIVDHLANLRRAIGRPKER
jgi:hypothetical protein